VAQDWRCVVMPFGHTPLTAGKDPFYDTDFGGDLLDDLVPYIDRHFRTDRSADRRAMAGLSMGGAHTLAFGLPHPEVFGQIGVFSMGFYLPGQDKTYTDLHDAQLRRRAAGATRPVFLAMGKTDFLYGAVGRTRKMMDEYGIRYVYHESGGGHVWENWRAYLALFAPTLFR
jgi:enterochelin esterase family protein